MTPQLEAMRDPGASDQDLARSAGALGPVIEPAAWWNDIAGDPRYRAHHRAVAIVQLFRRHLAPGASLAPLAAARWLDRSSIATIDAVAGKLPLAYHPDDTVVVAAVVAELATEISAIYVRIGGRWSREQIIAGLLGSAAAPAVQAYAILDGGGAVRASAP